MLYNKTGMEEEDEQAEEPPSLLTDESNKDGQVAIVSQANMHFLQLHIYSENTMN